MAIYSKLLAWGARTVSGDLLVYSTPINKVGVVRSISLSHTDGTPGKMGVTVRPSGSADYAWIYVIDGAAMWTSGVWHGRMVVPYGYVLHVYSDRESLRYAISGYELTE